MVYWLSPQTIPRYIIMLYPLLIVLFSHAYFTYRNQLPVISKLFNAVIIISCTLITLFIPAAFFAGLENYVSALPLKVLVIFLSCAFLSWRIYKSTDQKIVYFLAFMLVLRQGFSWFVLPFRYQQNDYKSERAFAEEAGKLSNGQAFYLYQYHPEIHTIPQHHKYIFYIERARMQPVKFTETDSLPGYYFTFDRDLKNPAAKLIKIYKKDLKLFRIQ